MRKICKLDPDVKGISKESALLITKAAELFTSKLGRECVVMAQMQNWRKLMTDDIVTVYSTKEAFMFLRADLQDVKDEQEAEAKMNKKDKERAAKTGEISTISTARNNLDSYFGRPTSATKPSRFHTVHIIVTITQLQFTTPILSMLLPFDPSSIACCNICSCPCEYRNVDVTFSIS
jgi:hypothetical protein